VLTVGSQIPDARVWLGPRDRISLRDLVADQGPMLLLFFLFDWSAT
jgi:hypothetical protein